MMLVYRDTVLQNLDTYLGRGYLFRRDGYAFLAIWSKTSYI